MSNLFLTIFILGQNPLMNMVGRVQFQGNRTFPARTLLSIVQTRPNQPLTEVILNQDLRTLEDFYRSQGFFSVRVDKGTAVVKGKTVVTFFIQEGERTRVRAITIEGNRAFSTGKLMREIPIATGAPLTKAGVLSGVEVLRRVYLNSGYPFVSVHDSIEEQEEKFARVRFVIDEGPRCYIGAVRIRGNRRVRTATIVRTTEIKPGEIFSQRRLEGAQRRLYATKLFARALFYVSRIDSTATTASLHTELSETASVAVRFDVVEQEQRGFALGVGFETPPSRAVFSVEWEHNNFLNRGQWLIASSSFGPDLAGNYRANFDLTWRVPYFFWARVDFQTHPFFYYERFDSTTQKDYGILTGMARDMLPQLRIGIFNRLRWYQQNRPFSESGVILDTSRGVTNSVLLILTYDSRDNILDPRAGIFFQPQIELAGGPFLGNNDFFRAVVDLRYYQAIANILTLALRTAAGRAVPYGRSRIVPYYEEFSLGGSNNLRGYPERALGPDTATDGRYGPVVVNGNLELRGPYLFRWVGIVGFLDLGQVAGQRDIFLRGIEFGAGAGVRIRTPIGPVRVDWGKRLKSAPAGDWGRFYIGVLHAF